MADLDDLDPDEVSFRNEDEPTDIPVVNPDAQAQADEDQHDRSAPDDLSDDRPLPNNPS